MPTQQPAAHTPGWVKVAIVAVACLGAFLLGTAVASNIPAAVAAFDSRLGLALTITACSAILLGCPLAALLRNRANHTRIVTALRASEARFRNLADSLPQIVWTAGPDSDKPAYLNNRWSEYTGLPGSDLEMNSRVIHPDDLIPMYECWKESTRTGNVFEYEFRMRPGESGPYLWFLARGVPVRNSAGEITEWFGTSTDIDELKQTEQALRQSQRHFRELAESMPQLVWTDLPDGYCDYLSPQWVAYTGVPAAEHLGFGWVDQLCPEDREGTYAAWNRAVAAGTNFEFEYRLRRADGVYRWFQSRAIPLRDEKGAVVKWFGTCTDIDDLKCAAGVVRENVARFHSTFDGIVEGCQIIDFDWHYLYVNDSVAVQARRTKEELIGRTMMEVYPGIEMTELFGTLWRCMQDRSSHRFENRFDYAEGGTAWFDLSIQPVPEGIFILSADITDRKREVTELRRSNAELKSLLAERTPQPKAEGE